MLTLSENIAQLEAQVEKVTREKVSALNQLEELQSQLTSREADLTKVQRQMLVSSLLRYFLWKENFSSYTELRKECGVDEFCYFKVIKVHLALSFGEHSQYLLWADPLSGAANRKRK